MKSKDIIEEYNVPGGDIEKIQILREKTKNLELRNDNISCKVTEVIFTYYNGKTEKKCLSNEKNVVTKVLKEVNFNKEVLKALELAMDSYYEEAEKYHDFDTEPVYNPWAEMRKRLLEGIITWTDVEEITTLIRNRTIFSEFDYRDYIEAGRAKGIRIQEKGEKEMSKGRVNVESKIKKESDGPRLINKGDIFYTNNGIRDMYLIVSVVGYKDGIEMYNLYDVEDASFYYQFGDTREELSDIVDSTRFKLVKNSKVIIEGEL